MKSKARRGVEFELSCIAVGWMEMLWRIAMRDQRLTRFSFFTITIKKLY